MKNLVHKFFYFLITILFAMTTIFFLFRLAPGDPVERILGPEASQIEIDNYRSILGLDRPLGVQYVAFIKSATRGDFGESYFNKKAVLGLLKERLLPTFTLAILSLLLSTFLGLSIGTVLAVNRGNIVDKLLRPLSLIFLALPVFSLAPILVIIFSIKLHLFPVSEWGDLPHLVLPLMTLVLPMSTVLMRITRNKLLEEKDAYWLLVLKAKGLSQFKVTLRHLKSALPTILNIVAMQFSVVLAGAMLTETLYDIPGMGTLLFEGIQNRDYPVVQGIVIYSTFITVSIYFLVDYLNCLIDPRIELN